MGSYVQVGGGEAEADGEPMCVVFSSWKGTNSRISPGSWCGGRWPGWNFRSQEVLAPSPPSALPVSLVFPLSHRHWRSDCTPPSVTSPSTRQVPFIPHGSHSVPP